MISPIKMTVATLSAVKMYVHDFPSSFPTKFLVKMGTKIELIAKSLIFGKSSLSMGIKTSIKPLLKMFANPEPKMKIDVGVKSFLLMNGEGEAKMKIISSVTSSGRYFVKDANIKPSIKMSVTGKSLIYYKNYERSTQTWAEVFADSSMNTNAGFLYREV